MRQTFLAPLAVAIFAAGILAAADEKGKEAPKPTAVTITRVDANKGEITVKFLDDNGKEQQKTFQLTKDIRYLDETGRAAVIDVFESGHDALMIESEGRLKELRRAGRTARTQRLSDAVRTLIEMADNDAAAAEEVQQIYDLLRNLDPAKTGKIDANALKAESSRILEERVKGAFDRLDANKDGKISKEEAKGLIKDHFDRIDANKDGFIDRDELLKAAREKRDAKAAETKASDKEKN